MRILRIVGPTIFLVASLAACNGNQSIVAVDRIQCEALGARDSYHFSSRTAFEVRHTGIAATPDPGDLTPFALSWEVDADVVTGGESMQANLKTRDGGGIVETEVIEIGPDAWSNLVSGSDFIKVEQRGTLIPFPPAQTCQALIADLDLASMTGTPEKVNSISSMKYEIDALPSTALADIPSIGGSSDAVTVVKEYNGAIWVASDGYISKLDLSGTGEYESGRQAIDVELKFEYSDINGVDTEIVAPVPR